MADIESLGEQAGHPPEASETTAAYLRRLNAALELGLDAEIDDAVAALEKQRFAPEDPTETEQAALDRFEQALRDAVDDGEPTVAPEPNTTSTEQTAHTPQRPSTEPTFLQRAPVKFRARFPSRSERLLVVGLVLIPLLLVGGVAGGVLAPGETFSNLGGTPAPTGNVTATPTSAADTNDTLDDDGLNATRERLIGTDPTVADTDGDGLADGREVELGLNPVAADSDGDGLNDSVEVAGPTDPLQADTDGDGLDDLREVNGPTSPVTADTDDDWLNDSAELAHGTDPTIADTDGDRLRDGWEVRGETPDGAPLPDADPRHKDLYVLVSRGTESFYLQDSDRAQIRGAFQDMPVTNPDGTEGIDVHIVEGETLSLRRSFAEKSAAEEALAANSTEEVMGAREGVYHHVILMRIDDDADFDAAAATPGRTVLVDEDERSPRNGTLPYRDRLIIRGLLQNIAGHPAPEYQADGNPDLTTEGWTAHDPSQELRFHEYLPDHLAAKLSEGFALLDGT